ncbi:hypothetical protein HDZ31DRAFT_78474, partial [Schizophyllum fasciatum]
AALHRPGAPALPIYQIVVGLSLEVRNRHRRNLEHGSRSQAPRCRLDFAYHGTGVQTLWKIAVEFSLLFPDGQPGPLTGHAGAKAILNAMALYATMDGAMAGSYKQLRESARI